MKPNWDKLYREYCEIFAIATSGTVFEFKKTVSPNTLFNWFKEKLYWTDEDLLKFAISYYNYRQKEPITISNYLEIWKNERTSYSDRENNNSLPG